MAKFTYTISVLGLVFDVDSTNLDKAREKVLKRWLNVIDPDRRNHPLVPPLFLLRTTDDRVDPSELSDPRIILQQSPGLKQKS